MPNARLMTKHVVSDKGERLKILVNKESGLPLFYPNFYITSQIKEHTPIKLTLILHYYLVQKHWRIGVCRLLMNL